MNRGAGDYSETYNDQKLALEDGGDVLGSDLATWANAVAKLGSEARNRHQYGAGEVLLGRWVLRVQIFVGHQGILQKQTLRSIINRTRTVIYRQAGAEVWELIEPADIADFLAPE